MYEKYKSLFLFLVAAKCSYGGDKNGWDWKRKFKLEVESISSEEVKFSVVGRINNYVTVKGDFLDPYAGMIENGYGSGDKDNYGSGDMDEVMEDYELDFGSFQLCNGERGLQFKYNGTDTLEVVVDYSGFDGRATCIFDL